MKLSKLLAVTLATFLSLSTEVSATTNLEALQQQVTLQSESSQSEVNENDILSIYSTPYIKEDVEPTIVIKSSQVAQTEGASAENHSAYGSPYYDSVKASLINSQIIKYRAVIIIPSREEILQVKETVPGTRIEDPDGIGTVLPHPSNICMTGPTTYYNVCPDCGKKAVYSVYGNILQVSCGFCDYYLEFDPIYLLKWYYTEAININ